MKVVKLKKDGLVIQVSNNAASGLVERELAEYVDEKPTDSDGENVEASEEKDKGKEGKGKKGKEDKGQKKVSDKMAKGVSNKGN